MKWVLGGISLGGAGFVLLIAAAPTRGDGFLGSCLLALGGFHVLFYRRLGTSTFNQARSLPKLFARPWNVVGESGAQHLYLGIGIAALSAAIFLLVRA
jgi:hypothetical protein